MARQMGEFSKAIRSLFVETNGEISHVDARVKLAEMGFELATAPDLSLNQQFKDFEANFEKVTNGVDYDPKDKDQMEAFRLKACKQMRLSAADTRRLMDEIQNRLVYKAEQNSFNVNKYNWRMSLGATSTKPEEKSSSKSLAAAKSGRTSKPVVIKKLKKNKLVDQDFSPESQSEALKYIRQFGGFTASQEKLKELESQLEEVQQEVETLRTHLEVIEALKHEIAAA